MADWLHSFAYVGIVIALVGRGVGLPLPEDISLLTAGYLCAQGMVKLGVVLPLAWFCIVLADVLSFAGGRLFGQHLPRVPVLKWVVRHSHLKEAERFYERHGLKALLVARLLPGLRSPLFFIAATAGVSFRKFLLIDACVAPLNVMLLVGLGWYFPQQLQRMKDATAAVQMWTGVAFLVLVGVTVGVRLLMRRLTRGRADEGERDMNFTK